MKILQVCDNHQIVGGAEAHYRGLSEKLRKHAQVYNFSMGEQEVKKSNLFIFKEHPWKWVRSLQRFTFNFRLYRQLKKYIRHVQPDVIHLHKIDNKYVNTLLLACKGKKIVYTVHDCGQVCITGWCTYKDTLEECDGNYGLKCAKHKCIPAHYLPPFYVTFKFRDHLTKKYVSQYICPSKMLTQRMQRHGYKKVHNIPYFIEKQPFVRKTITEPKTIIFVGRLALEKGLNYLIEAMSFIQDKEIKLIIVGGGPAEKQLKEQVKQLGLEKRIQFKGKVPHEDVFDLYKQYPLVVVPSIWQENYPVSILEAISFGCVILGSKIGGIQEQIIHGKTGYTFTPKDPAAIAKTIESIAGDTKKILSFGKEAKMFCEKHHDFSKQEKELFKLYAE